ncbi:helix-turn-helix transcriptional regulator [Planotetraspora phitsanulokensis]|uniref:Transcriptional regulator n=1 Tax=Planotetraspora phitsanulokensis TaxID=575192 RepID=A0A8J3U059_9ACTN|nr:transcriptional regulator [Planotetraspora phitsanulokensis]
MRRDEVALLAGVSIDYYTRLEQGRQRSPSEQVIDALARVLCRDADATAHLHELARPRAGLPECTHRPVDLHVVQLMEQWTHAPAYVVNHRLDVLARNRMAAALWEGYEHTDNLMRFTFLNPQSREYFLEWEGEAAFKVAHLRAMTVAVRHDKYQRKLIEELSDKSEDFRRLWARHDVRATVRDPKLLRHRKIGDLTLWRQMFSMETAPGHHLFVSQAEPGSSSEHALSRLAAMGPGE